jgi:integrase
MYSIASGPSRRSSFGCAIVARLRIVALRMFYRDYLQRDWKLWEQFEIRRDQPLPMVLTRDEVHQLLGAVRENRFKAVVALIYHCGLRVGEAVRLRPKDIDSKRGMLRVIDGKGGRNREVPVAPQNDRAPARLLVFSSQCALALPWCRPRLERSAHAPCRLPWRLPPSR